jgi:hypothetical protein
LITNFILTKTVFSENEKSQNFNGLYLSELNFFVTQTLTWILLLMQTWLKAIPAPKKKKNSTAESGIAVCDIENSRKLKKIGCCENNLCFVLKTKKIVLKF